jgi:hypothetical protein
MSGFLDKKKRIIDYKLSDSGIEKIARNKFKLKYYTFSDSSIVYSQNYESTNDQKVSDSEKFYMPFENDSNISVDLNPELNLDNIINYENRNAKFLVNSEVTDKTLSEKIIEKRYIDDITINDENFSQTNIRFEHIEEEDEFDFGNNNFTRRYPTIKFVEEDIKNIDLIQDDKRFLHTLRNRNLPPISSESIVEDNETLTSLPVNFIYKSYENNELYIDEDLSREETINIVIKTLKNDTNIFKLKYDIKDEDKKDEDVYVFELHTVLSNNNLEKLSFIKLGEFIDEETFVQSNVFLIGKIYLTRDIKDFIDKENNNLVYQVDNDYSFVNMFTLVVE